MSVSWDPTNSRRVVSRAALRCAGLDRFVGVCSRSKLYQVRAFPSALFLRFVLSSLYLLTPAGEESKIH